MKEGKRGKKGGGGGTNRAAPFGVGVDMSACEGHCMAVLPIASTP